MRYIGIDVSKDELVVAYLDEQGRYKLMSFENTPAGIEKLIKTLQLETDHCVWEADPRCMASGQQVHRYL